MNNQALARKLPDIPRWVEARGVLLRGQGKVFGYRETPEPAFVVRDPATRLVSVIGLPDPEAILRAVHDGSGGNEVIAPWENRAYVAGVLPEWTMHRAIIHQLGDDRRLTPVPTSGVRLMNQDELAMQSDIPEKLQWELTIGAEHSPVAASFVDGKPVSFCYAGAVTESLWDISIDTLSAYRRRGYAARCVTFMIRYMRTRGKQPVWGALENNPASWRLAEKLGFVPVDALTLLERRNDAGTAS